MAHSTGKRACRRGVHVARRRRAGWPTMRPIRPGPATHRQRTVFMNDGGKPPIRGPSRRIAGPPAWCRQPSAGPEPAAGRCRRRNQRPCGAPARPRSGARYAAWGRALGGGGPGMLADGRPAQRCGGRGFGGGDGRGFGDRPLSMRDVEYDVGYSAMYERMIHEKFVRLRDSAWAESVWRRWGTETTLLVLVCVSKSWHCCHGPVPPLLDLKRTSGRSRPCVGERVR